MGSAAPHRTWGRRKLCLRGGMPWQRALGGGSGAGPLFSFRPGRLFPHVSACATFQPVDPFTEFKTHGTYLPYPRYLGTLYTTTRQQPDNMINERTPMDKKERRTKIKIQEELHVDLVAISPFTIPTFTMRNPSLAFFRFNQMPFSYLFIQRNPTSPSPLLPSLPMTLTPATDLIWVIMKKSS